MTDPAVTAKQLVDLARKNIESQQRRIARQRELMAKYERDVDVARLSGARLVLERMQKQLAQMTAAHVAAEEHLSKVAVDEASVEKVVRDTPIACGEERAMISHRTKVVLAAAKERGLALGNPKLSKARKSAVASIKALADQHAANVLPIIREIRRAGATSLHQIADALNVRGITTPRGGQWHASSVRNVFKRA